MQVEFLLANGADVDVQANCGATALHYAAECGHVDICSQLLDYGATLKKNEYGMTAVITAAERTRELVVEMFYTRPDLLTKEEVCLLIYFVLYKLDSALCGIDSNEISILENRRIRTYGCIICQ